jgi:multicomponent Na+:H+ antiporter subunit F
MKTIRWVIGLIIVLLFLFGNFFIYTGNIYFKLINVILFCTLFVLFRVVFGPSAADRIVAVDILGILVIGLLALMGLYYDQSFFMDVGLIWALLSFVASLAFAKVLEGRSLDD